MIFFFVISESKPHQDVLNEKSIKIEAITEVKGVQGIWKLVALCVYFSLIQVESVSMVDSEMVGFSLTEVLGQAINPVMLPNYFHS